MKHEKREIEYILIGIKKFLIPLIYKFLISFYQMENQKNQSLIANAKQKSKAEMDSIAKAERIQKGKKEKIKKQNPKLSEAIKKEITGDIKQILIRKGFHGGAKDDKENAIIALKGPKEGMKQIRGLRRTKRDRLSFLLSDAKKHGKDNLKALQIEYAEFLSIYYPNAYNALKGDSGEYLKALSNKLFQSDAFLKAEERNQKANLISAFDAMQGFKADKK